MTIAKIGFKGPANCGAAVVDLRRRDKGDYTYVDRLDKVEIERD
jgi:hypothetical protein